MRGHFDRPIKRGERKLGLLWIERIAIERADGRDSDTERFCFVRELFGKWLPVGVFEAAFTLLESDPFNRTEAEPMRPFQFIDFTARQHANSHASYLRRIASDCKRSDRGSPSRSGNVSGLTPKTNGTSICMRHAAARRVAARRRTAVRDCGIAQMLPLEK